MPTTAAARLKWKKYWTGQTTPQHAGVSEAYYRCHAAELKLLMAGCPVDRVLEIGVGDGALFVHLGFDRARRYVGVDFSPGMLHRFRARFPGVDVVLADGADFRSTEQFDLVFSNQVIQYWDREQLARHLDHAMSMVGADGAVILAGIPWSRMRLAYARGDLTGGPRRSLPGTVIAALRELAFPRIGYWYDLPDIERLSSTRHLQAEFRGSSHYPYRFHAVLRRPT